MLTDLKPTSVPGAGLQDVQLQGDRGEERRQGRAVRQGGESAGPRHPGGSGQVGESGGDRSVRYLWCGCLLRCWYRQFPVVLYGFSSVL